MTAEFLRDAAMTAVIFGVFASSWFGWAQEKPPAGWSGWLGVASALSLLTAAGGGVVAWQHWDDGTVFGPGTGQSFGIVVGIEVLLAGLGSLVLIRRKRADLVAPWIALVVGVHFFPLAVILEYPALHVVAALVSVVAVASVPYARRRSWTVSAATGVGTGTVLLAAAVFSLVRALTAY